MMETTVKQSRRAIKPDMEIEALQNELLNLMLKKAGLKYDDLIASSIKRWMAQNMDILAENELEKYKKVIL